MAQGTIKWFDPKKGYGFIKPDDGSKDAFLHISALEKANITQLDEGQIIEQDVGRVDHTKSLKDFVSMGRDIENVVLMRAINWQIQHRIIINSNSTIVFN